MTDAILKNHRKIQEILRLRNGRSMTEKEFREQCHSFIIGNAFDVFPDPDVVNRKLLKDIAKRRLQVAR